MSEANRIARLMPAAILLALVVGCAIVAAVPTAVSSQVSSTPTQPASGPETASITGRSAMAEPTDSPSSKANQLLERARREVAQKEGISLGEVTVVQVEAVEWRDSSLGCPEPGRLYLQVITPGYRFILQAKGQSYEYHTDQGSQLVLCQRPSTP